MQAPFDDPVPGKDARLENGVRHSISQNQLWLGVFPLKLVKDALSLRGTHETF